MKTKTILFFLLSIPLCFLTNMVAADFYKKAIAETPVEVTFGRRAPCIAGSGICSMNAISEHSQGEGDATGKLYLTKSGHVVLEIDKASISVSKSEEQFVDQKFTISEDFKIPATLLELIKSPTAQKSLEAGIYDIVEQEDFYRITF